MIDDFNKMILELQSNTLMKKDFISNFSHEFKTPIVSIKGYAELLYETPNLDIETRNTYLKIIIEEARRLAKLSNETMLLSKLDSTEIIDHQEEYFLDEQIKECILLLDHELQTKDIDIEVNLNPIKFYGNRDLLKEVWINLLNNAIESCEKCEKERVLKIKCIYEENEGNHFVDVEERIAKGIKYLVKEN